MALHPCAVAAYGCCNGCVLAPSIKTAKTHCIVTIQHPQATSIREAVKASRAGWGLYSPEHLVLWLTCQARAAVLNSFIAFSQGGSSYMRKPSQSVRIIENSDTLTVRIIRNSHSFVCKAVVDASELRRLHRLTCLDHLPSVEAGEGCPPFHGAPLQRDCPSG